MFVRDLQFRCIYLTRRVSRFDIKGKRYIEKINEGIAAAERLDDEEVSHFYPMNRLKSGVPLMI